jgi:hypothetical protein
MRRRFVRSAGLAAALLALLFGAPSARAETTIGTGQLRLVGASFDVEPVAQAVPVGVPAVLRTLFGGDPAGLAQAGLRVSAELSGPGLAAPVTLTTAPGADLRLPALQVRGEYRLEAIRLTDGAGTSVPAAHSVATVAVTDVLVSSISSRVLTPGELADRGIVVDDRNLKAFSFALGLAIQGRTIGIELPALVWNGTEYQAIGPPRTVVEGPPLERFQPPTVVAVPLVDSDGIPPPFEDDGFGEDAVVPRPVFGLLVFPGSVRFLNQFLSVVLMVQNGSPEGSGLVLKDVATTVSLPASALRLAGTTPAVADGQPIPIRHPGPDGVLDTPDDLVVLAARQAGSAEMVAEGLKVGTHEVVCEIGATLDGLAGQPPRRLSGRARGSVVIRDPSFALTFNHPEVVRKDEEYELRVTVANTSTVRANEVSLALDAASLAGAVPLDTPPGAEPFAVLGDILPGDASDARFRLRATRTGRVVASAFTSDGAIAGSLRFRTGVTNDGLPLSPDSFVFPSFVSVLPAPFVDAATRLIGIAHGLATADATVPGSLAPSDFSDGSVRSRATELVAAARRVRIGQSVPSGVADVLLRWLGSRDEIPGYDLVRRVNSRGRELEAAAASSLADLLLTLGRTAFDQAMLDAAAANAEPASPGRMPAGPAIVVLESTDPAGPAARLRLTDVRTGAETSGAPGEVTALREVPYAALVRLEAPGGGEASLVGRLPGPGLELTIQGRRTGSVGLDVLFPDGQGGFSRIRFGDIPVREGSLTTTRLTVGATQLVLSSSIDGTRAVSASSASPSPFAAVAAVQDVDANPLGKVVTLLFNRAVNEGAASELRLWRLPTTTRGGAILERVVAGVSTSTDPRLVSLLAGGVVSPVRPGTARGDLVPSGAGESWSGALAITPRLAAEGGEIEGRVLGPDGAPLPDVAVRLSEAATDDLSGRSFEATTATTLTDARGSFAFDFVRRQDGKPFRLDAIDPASGARGWAAGSIRQNGDLVHVDVALLGRGTVRGVVVDATGARVAGTIVRCSSSVDSYRSSQFSAADGSFVFPSVPVGTLQLQAEDPRTRETTWATAGLDAPGASTEVTLVLAARPRARLSGRVVRGAGAPIAGAWVAGYGETGEYFGARKTTLDGVFLFESAPAGAVRLEVFDGISREPVLVQPLTLLPDGVHDVTLVVEVVTPRFGAVGGVVRRTLGGVTTPVAGAPVWVSKGGLRTTSGADGSYLIDDVPVGTTNVLALLPSSGRGVSTSTTILEGLTASADLLFADASLGSVRGTVVDQAGQPRADALVEIWDEGPPLRLVSGTRSGGDGAFQLQGVPPGSWRVQATATETRNGMALRNAGSTTATLPGPGASATVALDLRGFVDVTGRVVARVRGRNGELVESPVLCTVEVAAGHFSGALSGDPEPGGDPEAGRVFADGPGFAGSVRTDPSTGTFRFRFVHGGPIRLVAKNPFYGERVVDLGVVKGDAARGPVDIVFDGSLGVVDGFLFDPAGVPVAGAPVSLSPLGTPFGDPLEATTGPDGGFLFPLVPFGLNNHVVFSGSLGGLDRWAEARVGVTASSPRARVTLRVVPIGEVTVRVVQSVSGAISPVPGAQVRVEEADGPKRSFNGSTDAEGIARFSGVSAGPLAVRARKDLVAGRGSALGAGEGFRVDAVVTLAQSAEVTGVVRRPSDGTGLGGVNVLVDAGQWKGILGAATTDADGRFLVEGLPGGDGTVYRIRAEDPRTLRGGSSPVFLLSQGEVKEVDVTLRGIGSVTGVLRTFDGTRALAGAEVDVASHAEDGTESPALRVSTGEDGRYRADGVPEGAILVRARVPLSGLSARATGSLSGEGATLSLDLSASPTGRVRGAVLAVSGGPLPGGGLAPEVRLEAGATHETRLSAEYDFVEVDATEPLLLQASERVEPFHGGLLRGRAVAGQTVVANVRYAPFGTLRVRVVKPDPEHHGLFLPAPGVVVLSCGEPYANRFPCGAPVRTDPAGNATFPNVGGGAPGRLVATEEATGASGASGVAPFVADGETRDVTVVVETRGLVRGRLLLPAGAGPAGDASVIVQQQDVRGDWITVASTVSGGDGRFELRDVGFGSLVLRAATTIGLLARAEMAFPLSAATPIVDTGDLLLDGERPRVVFVTPSDGASGVGLTPVLEAAFSEPLGAALHGRRPQEFVELSGPYGIVPVIVALGAGDTSIRLALANGASLAGATTYLLRVLGSLPDRSGLTLGGDVVVRFTTADLTAPTVLTSSPLPGQIQVATDVNPVVVFTKVLDAGTVASGVRLERRDAPQGPVACAPALRADGRTVALNPGSPLAEEADYEIVVDGVADTAGNHLPSTVRIPFLTRDDHAPVVTLDVPATSTPLEGSTQAFTLRFVDDDVARVRLTIVAATGSTTCGENDPGPLVRAVSFSCRLPLISAAGGTSVVVRAEGSDRSGNSALPSDTALTLAPDAPPVLTVTSPSDGTRFLSGTTIRVVGSVEEDNGPVTVTLGFGRASRTASGPGSFSVTLPVPIVAAPATLVLAISAVDTAGNAARPVAIPLGVDPDVTFPSISIAAPEQGSGYIGGRPLSLVASAADDATGVSLRWRAGGGAWSAPTGGALSIFVSTPVVLAETPFLLELEARDGAGNVTPMSRSVRLLPNLAPVLTVTAPGPGFRVTAQTSFLMTGTASDDGGLPTVTATYGGTTRTSTAAAFSFSFPAPAVSTPTETTVRVVAADAEGNTSPPVDLPVTVVPDAGGTPTIVLSPPAPAVLFAGEGVSVALTYADNVGLEAATAEATGGLTSGGRLSFTLAGTSVEKVVPLATAAVPFGTPARILATLRNISARTATLDVALPVAFHRLETPLPAGPIAEGSLLSLTFRLTPEGRARAVALRLEIGTKTATGFTALACAQRSAPLAELEALSVGVPAGRTGLVLRSVLVEADGREAPAADTDGRALFERPLVTTADTTAPTVAIVAPAEADTFSAGSSIIVDVTAADDVRVRSIEVTFVGVTKACAASPCRASFFAPQAAAPANHTITAVAKDASGRSASASVSVTVTPTAGAPRSSTNPHGDGRRPRVSFVTPALSPAAVPPSSSYVPWVDASDQDGIETIELFLGADTREPCLVLRMPEDSWPPRKGCAIPDLPEGTQLALVARATDRAGESAEARSVLVVREGLRIRGPALLAESGDDLADATLYVEGEVAIDGAILVGELHLRAGAALRPSATGTTSHAIRIRASGDLVLDAGSTVDVSGTGSWRASELDPGSAPDREGDGGPHGGDAGVEGALRAAYGSASEPVLPGARGGIAGTFGGGVVSLFAKRIVLAGVVEANGEDGNADRPAWRGLGAGGSVSLVAEEMVTGPVDMDDMDVEDRRWGFLSARGGAPSPVEAVPFAGAFAAGGRLSLSAPRLVLPLLDVSGTRLPEGPGSGRPGTIFVRDALRPDGVLFVPPATGGEGSPAGKVP